MSYEFKVGDKGKTKGGNDYEVLLKDNRLGEYPIAVLITSKLCPPFLHQTSLSGKSRIGWSDDLDLLSPKRTITYYFNVYEEVIHSHKSEEEAIENSMCDVLLMAHKVEFEV